MNATSRFSAADTGLVRSADAPPERVTSCGATRLRARWLRGVGCVVMALCAAATFAKSDATADTFPNRPIRIVLALPVGGAPDTIARILGNKLTEQLKQQIVVDARPGASGVIAAQIAKAAAPDGYTMLLAGGTLFSALPALRKNLPYDVDKDFLPLSRVASVPNVVAVSPSLPVNSVEELVKLAGARPGQLNFGSGGNGSTSHLAGEMLNVLAHVRMIHVPYKSVPLAVNDLIGGNVQVVIGNAIGIMQHASSGRVKAIATTGPARDPYFPELPAVGETLQGYVSTSWWGIALPAHTPEAVVDKLHSEIMKALQSNEARDLLAKHKATAHPESRSEFRAFIKSERERISNVARAVGMTLD